MRELRRLRLLSSQRHLHHVRPRRLAEDARRLVGVPGWQDAHDRRENDAGQERFRRVIDIVTLDDEQFTYRVYPDPANKAVYYDIIHTPTTHAEPTE
ncbi:DUF4822 domain-containing protein [Nocardia xishanensis]